MLGTQVMGDVTVILYIMGGSSLKRPSHLGLQGIQYLEAQAAKTLF